MKPKIYVCITLVIWGCATASIRQTPVAGSVSDEEISNYSGTGECAIEGQVFLRTRGGDVRYGAGESVLLQPDTSPLRNAVTILRAGGIPKWSPDQSERTDALKRRTTSDGDGRFEFQSIPCGRWLVGSQVYWEVFGGSASYREGGILTMWIEVTPAHSPAKAILSKVGWAAP